MPGIAVTHPACPACQARAPSGVYLGSAWAGSAAGGGGFAQWGEVSNLGREGGDLQIGQGRPQRPWELPGSIQMARRWGWRGNHPHFPWGGRLQLQAVVGMVASRGVCIAHVWGWCDGLAHSRGGGGGGGGLQKQL